MWRKVWSIYLNTKNRPIQPRMQITHFNFYTYVWEMVSLWTVIFRHKNKQCVLITIIQRLNRSIWPKFFFLGLLRNYSTCAAWCLSKLGNVQLHASDRKIRIFQNILAKTHTKCLNIYRNVEYSMIYIPKYFICLRTDRFSLIWKLSISIFTHTSEKWYLLEPWYSDTKINNAF